MSKIRKQPHGQYDASEIFSDEDFDSGEFVEQMDNRDTRQRVEARSGWRRIEELREEQMLRDQLLELDAWDEFGDD